MRGWMRRRSMRSASPDAYSISTTLPPAIASSQSRHDSRLIGNGDVEGERWFGELPTSPSPNKMDSGLGTGKVAENPQAKVQSRDLLTGETQRLLQGYRIEDMDAVVVPELNIDKLVRPYPGMPHTINCHRSLESCSFEIWK